MTCAQPRAHRNVLLDGKLEEVSRETKGYKAAKHEARGSVRELSLRRRFEPPDIIWSVDWLALIVLLTLDLYTPR